MNLLIDIGLLAVRGWDIKIKCFLLSSNTDIFHVQVEVHDEISVNFQLMVRNT